MAKYLLNRIQRRACRSNSQISQPLRLLETLFVAADVGESSDNECEQVLFDVSKCPRAILMESGDRSKYGRKARILAVLSISRVSKKARKARL